MEICGERIYRRGHGFSECQRSCYLRKCGHCSDHCVCFVFEWAPKVPDDSDDDEIIPTQDDLDFIAPEDEPEVIKPRPKRKYRVITESDDEE